jgi:hypothetical protein
MFAKASKVAERVAYDVTVSRRGFFSWLGRGGSLRWHSRSAPDFP